MRGPPCGGHLAAAESHQLPQGPVLRLRVARAPRAEPLLERLFRRLRVPEVPGEQPHLPFSLALSPLRESSPTCSHTTHPWVYIHTEV